MDELDKTYVYYYAQNSNPTSRVSINFKVFKSEYVLFIIVKV